MSWHKQDATGCHEEHDAAFLECREEKTILSQPHRVIRRTQLVSRGIGQGNKQWGVMSVGSVQLGHKVVVRVTSSGHTRRQLPGEVQTEPIRIATPGYHCDIPLRSNKEVALESVPKKGQAPHAQDPWTSRSARSPVPQPWPTSAQSQAASASTPLMAWPGELLLPRGEAFMERGGLGLLSCLAFQRSNLFQDSAHHWKEPRGVHL